MKPVAVLACLITLSFGGCSWIPRAGPSASEVVEQSRSDGEILFDVVEVDDRVISTLRVQPKESFAARFTRDTQVESDGAISVPYAGRIPAAGRLPAEVQQTIEARLAGRALQPQALVIVKRSFANAVTVTGEVVAGARIPLSPGGDKLLEVIAAAGGAKAPVHETFVRLSRNGTTATIPLQQLVSDPAENVYARPGDMLTLARVPQTFAVFGATGRNADIPFSAAKISLTEALGKSQGLRDDLAKPEGVFLFRYEPNEVVRSLDQPTASGSGGGVSPIVYRFNLRDANSYLLTGGFPMRDKDVIFVADAPAAQIYKFFTALNQVTGPIVTGLVTCHYANC